MRVQLTNHARDRASEMGIPTKRIKRGVADPDMEYDAPAQYPGCRMAKIGQIVCPFAEKDSGRRIVITVLWWSPQDEFDRRQIAEQLAEKEAPSW